MTKADEIFIQTFESTAFLFLEANTLTLEQTEDSSYFLSECRFSGGINGTFSLILHRSAVESYLSFLFDDDYDPSPETFADTTRELANILCGNLITDLIDPTVDYYIDSPSFSLLPSLQSAPDIESYNPFLALDKFCGFRLTLTKDM